MHKDWRPSAELWRKLKPVARQMRREPTLAESILWQRIRKQQLNGVKFRRQLAIERFVVDFCSLEVHLIIEVDGLIHQYSKAEDAIRQEFLESMGFHVLRFSNIETLQDPGRVIKMIAQAIARAPSS
ncbi:MAG: DUF559 domain-containing protein [Chloroflexi bacterium]|nr:DUF559 domain-containing protein [Chloroflexota bacterium]